MKKILVDGLLGIVVSAVLLVGVELALGVAGIGGADTGQHLSRGFDAGASYFGPDPELEGALRTRYRGAEYETRIPAKKDEARVLMFGGSNVQGFPVHRLGQGLTEWAGRPFKAYNLGRNGYGSERVRVVALQALELLDPDIVVVYTGHNEFTERGFANELAQRWSSERAMRLAQATEGLRSVHALVGLFSPDPTTTEEPLDFERAVEPRGRPDRAFEKLQYEETLRYFAAYENNLRQICEAAAERGVKMVLGTPIYNRYSPPFSYSDPTDLGDADRAAFQRLWNEATQGFPDYFATLLPQRTQMRVHSKEWGKAKSVPFDTLDMPGWRRCRGALADFEPRLRGPQGWQPRILEMYEALDLLFAGPRDAAEQADLERSESLLLEALEIVPDNPLTLYHAGLVQQALERDAREVARHLEDSGRFDRAPRRASQAINGIVRTVARDFPEVLLVDSDQVFTERAPDGLTGWEVMIDHCHMNAGSARILMGDFVTAIGERWYPR